MNTSFEFPKVADNDPSDVAAAIETAQALWRRGDLQESLRWVRRAAEAAETEGDDMRALSLARAAADLQEQFRPSQAPPPPASQRAPERASAPTNERPAQTIRSAPPPARTSTVPSRASAAPSRAATELAGADLDIPKAPKLEPWAPPGGRAESPPARAAAQPEPPTPVAPSALEKKNRSAAPPPAEPKERVAAQPSAAPKERVAAPPPGDVRTAVRVSVDSSGKNGALVVHILDEGVRAPAGTYEALLVPLDKGIDPREG